MMFFRLFSRGGDVLVSDVMSVPGSFILESLFVIVGEIILP